MRRNDKISILFLLNDLENNSLNNITIRIVNYLAISKEFDIYLVISHTSKKNKYILPMGIIHPSVFLYEQKTIFSTIRLLPKLISDHNITIVQSQTLRGDYIFLLSKLYLSIFRQKRIFLISVKHNFLFGIDYKTRIIKNIGYLLSFLFVNHTICVGGNLKKRLLSYPFISPNRIGIISNGVHIRSNQEGKIGKDIESTILFASSFIQRKNPLLLLKTLNALTTPYKCFYYGNGILKKHMQKYIEKYHLNKRVFLKGFSSKIDAVLQQCAIYILPSQEEVCSLGLLEAMNYGLCCIVSNIPGNTEIITHKKNGLIFDLKNKNDLKKQIIYALNNPNEGIRLGYNAKLTVEKKYSEEVMLKAYYKYYLQVYKDLR